MKASMVVVTAALAGALLAPAAGSAQEVNRRDAERAKKLTEEGEKALRNERFEEAAIRFKGAIELDETLIPAHYGLGQAQMALHDYASAAVTLQGCKDLMLRHSLESQKEWAERDRKRRDAIRDLEQALETIRSGKIKGGEARGMEVQAETRLRQLREENLRGAEAQVKIPAELSLLLGSAYFRLQRFEDAEKNYSEAVDTDPKLGEAHNNLAVIYMLTNRFDESRRSIEAAESAGFNVHPQLKKDLEARAAAAPVS